ncbi:conserved exported hypothetical protein [Capnocytophaga canimorsus]|uniref:Uncharacterized protein n=1 Tax=Capnocytophaga canimorsus TaxID=28188 RepID=A0A0B7HIH5_9FLAO|nr:hypothetical protein [Capnocytophaga canimorsus]ATA77105.1 hypothetical protein CGC47_05660 [Capnocytophaga canimorsus]PJI83754.1 hypothetical protein CLV61_0361 [Capnocytophaga canimorsus]CEN37348.1 conserved exported hypothetical protein [Capnocytophaga canimorsus]STA72320.1 Uncharacterised protein [Capnocytophaga canimorsus]
MKTIKNSTLFLILALMMYSCSSPKLGKNRLDLEKFNLNFDVATFYADEIKKGKENMKELEKLREKRDKEGFSEKEKEALTEKIWELLDFHVIEIDTVLSGKTYKDERNPIAYQYDMRSWSTSDSLAYFQKMHFCKINMVTSLKGDFMALVAESESKGTDDFKALLDYLKQKHGKPTVKENGFYNDSFIYHWELDDRLLAIFSHHDNKESTLKLGIEVTEDGVKADTTKQPTLVTRLFILKNQYKHDSILTHFTRGNWSVFDEILEK